jgi:hypothetical protein
VNYLFLKQDRFQDLDWWDEVNNVGLKAHFIASQLAVPIMLRSSTVRYEYRILCILTAQRSVHISHIGNGRQVERPGLIVHVSSAGGLRYIFDVACVQSEGGRERGRERERVHPRHCMCCRADNGKDMRFMGSEEQVSGSVCGAVPKERRGADIEYRAEEREGDGKG